MPASPKPSCRQYDVASKWSLACPTSIRARVGRPTRSRLVVVVPEYRRGMSNARVDFDTEHSCVHCIPNYVGNLFHAGVE